MYLYFDHKVDNAQDRKMAFTTIQRQYSTYCLYENQFLPYHSDFLAWRGVGWAEWGGADHWGKFKRGKQKQDQ